MTSVLEGVRVLDLSWGIAGPITGMLLADHGADVIKVEPPGGDPFRGSPGYDVWLRGRRSVVLDLKQEGDRDSFLALAGDSDVVLEAFAPGTMDGLGLGAGDLLARNPRLIVCSITAYGPHAGHRDRPGYDALVAARLGILDVQRSHDGGAVPHMHGEGPFLANLEIPDGMDPGPPRPGPIFTYTPWLSMGAAFLATTGISAALLARQHTGRGQHVETSLLQAALSGTASKWQRVGRPDAVGYRSWVYDRRAPKGFFRCADDRWIQQWVPHPRFAISSAEGDTLAVRRDVGSVRTDPERIGPAPESIVILAHYFPEMAEAFSRFPSDQWTAVAAEAGVPLQPVRTPEEALADPSREAAGPAPVPERTERPPLDGITVLDIGFAVAGPWGTQVLADLGANVIKVNAWRDPWWHAQHIAYGANRGKRSIGIDLKSPAGLAVFRRLVATADVVHSNMRRDALARLACDEESLREVNPQVIYCHTRGFDRGPRSDSPGNDQTGCSLAGVTWEDGGCWDGGRPFWSLTHRKGLAGIDVNALDAAHLEPWFRARSGPEAFAALDAHGVPVELCDGDFGLRVFDDPEMDAHELVVHQQHPKLGSFEHFGKTIRFSGTPERIWGRRRCAASTPGRSCASTASATPRSTHSPRTRPCSKSTGSSDAAGNLRRS